MPRVSEGGFVRLHPLDGRVENWILFRTEVAMLALGAFRSGSAGGRGEATARFQSFADQRMVSW
jgi:hypothetical protein